MVIMLLNQSYLIGALLIYLAGTASACYRSGYSFKDVLGKDDITQYFNKFCKENADLEYNSKDNVSTTKSYVETKTTTSIASE